MTQPTRRALLRSLGVLSVGLAGCETLPGEARRTAAPADPPTDSPTAGPTPSSTRSPTPTETPTPPRVDRRCEAVWNPVERWRVPTGIRAYEPAVVDGVVYFGAQDDRLRAVDADDGTVVWRRDRDVFIYTRPAVADGTVVAPTYESVVAHEAGDGTRRWSFAPPGSQANIESATVAVGGFVGVVVSNYAGTQEEPPEDPYTRLYCVDLDDGTEVWHREFDDHYGVEGLAATGDAIVLAGDDGAILGFEPASGDVAWSTAVGGPIDGGPTAGAGVVAVRGSGFVAAVDAGAGTVRWRLRGSFHDSPAVAAGSVYCPTRREVVAIDAASGDVLWRAPIPGDRAAALSATRDVVYATVTEGDRAAKLAVDADAGCRHGRFGTEARNLTRAHVAGDRVFVGGLHGAGAMYAVSRPFRRDT